MTSIAARVKISRIIALRMVVRTMPWRAHRSIAKEHLREMRELTQDSPNVECNAAR
jgi:hypothetical protein